MPKPMVALPKFVSLLAFALLGSFSWLTALILLLCSYGLAHATGWNPPMWTALIPVALGMPLGAWFEKKIS